jgi:hypothetical protein
MLQRIIGNRGVQRMLAGNTRRQSSRLTIQAKLSVGPVDDHYEREADRVAASVMQTSGPAAPQVQRQTAEEEEPDGTIQTKSLAASITPLIQRQETHDDDDEKETSVQRQVDGGSTIADSNLEQDIERARQNGQSLPGDFRARMERSFGADFSAVRVHDDAQSDSLNRSVHARAFTTGQDVFFRRREYNPESRRGQQLIAHELTHVVQQNGRKPRTNGQSLQRASGKALQRSWLDELRGYFRTDTRGKYGNVVDASGVSRQRENYNRDRAGAIARLSAPVSSGVSSTTKFLTYYGTMAHEGRNLLQDTVPALSTTGQALSVMGAVGGGLGAAGALMNSVEGFQQARDSTATSGQSRLAFGRGVSGLTSATQQAATSAHHIGNLGSSAVATTAQVVSGGAAIATGAVDILRGSYAMHRARQNIARLENLRATSTNADIQNAARQAQSTQENRRSTGKWTVGKGVLLAGGGALLAASMATPIGWGLLAGAAIVGLISLALKFFRKRQRKVDVAMQALGVTESQMAAWRSSVKAIEKATWWGTDERSRQLAALGPDPLQKKLTESGFISPGHLYANYINYTANKIYEEGVAGRDLLETQVRETAQARSGRLREVFRFSDLNALKENLKRLRSMSYAEIRTHFRISADEDNLYPQTEELLAGMGLKFDFRKRPPEPKPEKIGKALHE